MSQFRTDIRRWPSLYCRRLIVLIGRKGQTRKPMLLPFVILSEAKDLVMRMHSSSAMHCDLVSPQRDPLHYVQDYASVAEPVPSPYASLGMNSAEGLPQDDICHQFLIPTCPQIQILPVLDEHV